jgi:hypothetical protein
LSSQGPVDAIAEFIDNSIQACRGVAPERNINIELFVDGFLMITDNGCGLNVADVEAFATFSLDQKTRGTTPTPNDSSFISKFGVGSKQAGFFLGDRITLISKKHNESKFLKFSLDYRNFQEKYAAKQNVYSDNVTKFPVREKNFFNQPKDIERSHEGLLNQIYLHQEKYSDQYAIFIIRLRPEILQKLLEKGRYQMRNLVARTSNNAASSQNVTHDLVKEIGEIYYFHLHPEHSLDSLETKLSKELNNNNNNNNEKKTTSSRRSSGGGAKEDRVTCPPKSTESPLKICYFEYERNILKYSQCINDSTNLISDCIQAAKDIFTFELSVPDLAPTTSSSSSSSSGVGQKKSLTQGAQSSVSVFLNRLFGYFF